MEWKRRGPPSFTLFMRSKRDGFLERMRPELRRSCPCPLRKRHPSIDLHYTRDIRVKFPVFACKFPVLSKKFAPERSRAVPRLRRASPSCGSTRRAPLAQALGSSSTNGPALRHSRRGGRSRSCQIGLFEDPLRHLRTDGWTGEFDAELASCVIPRCRSSSDITGVPVSKRTR